MLEQLLGEEERCILQAVARHSEDFSGLKVNWQTQTLLTAGATEALAATFLSLVNPGDEVLLVINYCA